MSDEHGKRLHNFRVGKTWFSIWENTNPASGNKYTSTTVAHHYRDETKGEWVPVNNYSDAELADLELGVREARRKLRLVEYPAQAEEKETSDHREKIKTRRAKSKTASPAQA
ncbi:MAG: hypothetical protein AAF591_14445 [Verrucomicrobiota bacterium]